MARTARFTISSVIPFILSLVPIVTSNCYCVRDNEISDCSARETTCGAPSSVDSGAQLCCVTGDVCGKDSICHFSKPIANTSGYYLGGCTDPTYKDPVCQKHCTDAGTADIVYNGTSQLWSCCGYPDNSVSCQSPRTDSTFQAIALNDFPGTQVAASTIPTTSFSSTSSSTSPSISSAISTSSASSATTANAGTAPANGTVIISQSSSGLSTGTIAGIAVAAVLIGLAAVAGFAFWFIRRKRYATAEADAAAAANMPDYFETPGYNFTNPQVNAEGVPEIDTASKDPIVAMHGFYGPRKPNTLHESDGRGVPAQLYGSEPTVTQLP